MEKLKSDKITAIGPYSPLVKTNGLLFLSGQIPLDFKSGEIIGKTIEEQTEKIIENIKLILEEANSDISKVVKTTCFLKNMSDFERFNQVYAKHFISKPSRSCVEVSALPKNALAEIEVIAEY